MRYVVRALGCEGSLVKLSIESTCAEEVFKQAAAQGYTVLTARRQQRLGWITSLFESRFPLVLFSQELIALLSAGLSLTEGLETLAWKEPRADIRRIIEMLCQSLYEGKPLSHALGQFPLAFSPLFVATVRASERTGDLTEALTRFVAYQSQLDFVRKKLVTASIYPALLMLVGLLVVLFLMGYVVPKFSRIFEDIGGDLPFASQVLLHWGQLAQAHAMTIFLALGVAIAGGVYLLTQEPVRAEITRRLWRIPALGERLRVYQLARLFRTLGMLLRGGMPIVPALGQVTGLLQPVLRDRLVEATKAIQEGGAISASLEAHGLTTPVSSKMLAVGEHTGAMGEMMERIATFYDEELSRWVERFTKLFEPLLMLFIGLVIGVIVVLMYMPIFELAGSIQ